MKLSKIVAVGLTVVLGFGLVGCRPSLPSGQAGAMIARESQRAAERVASGEILFGEGTIPLHKDGYKPASEATEKTAAEFVEHYLNFTARPNPGMVVEIHNIFQMSEESGEIPAEDFIKFDPMFSMYDYSGVSNDEDRISFAAYSMSRLLTVESFLQESESESFSVPESSVELSEEGEVVKAVVDASTLNISSPPYSEFYYLIFTDGGWKVDVAETMNNGL